MTQAKPSGQMGNPRRYASQPNRRFIKDATTGDYHENLCYVGPKGAETSVPPLFSCFVAEWFPGPQSGRASPPHVERESMSPRSPSTA